MKNEITFKSNDGLTDIHAYIWDVENPRAIIQFTHGMCEHAERYEYFAKVMNSKGFIFAAQDLLGHGKSVKDEYSYGYFAKKKGNEVLVEDAHSFNQELRKLYPNLPIIAIGHSFGSFVTRNFIQKYSDDMVGVIIIGSTFMSKLELDLYSILTSIIAIYHHGPTYISPYIVNLQENMLNKRFEERKQFPNCWINKNPKLVVENLNIEYANHKFTCNAYKSMFKLIKNCNSVSKNRTIRSDLPMLLLCGSNDSLGKFGEDIKKIKNIYERAGVKSVKTKVYNNMRHDIINDENRVLVHTDIINFINDIIKK